MDDFDKAKAAVDLAISLMECPFGEIQAVTARLYDAIVDAQTEAYAEGRADEREEWVEQAMRAMNETGQGEHLGVKP